MGKSFFSRFCPRLVSAVLFAVVCFGSNLALAQGKLRCDQRVVSRGFTFYEVAERCGDPIFEYSRIDYRYPGYTVQVDEWTYDLGRNRFRRLLRFENGRLVDIQTRRKPVNVRRSSFGS